MARIVPIAEQEYAALIQDNSFYLDKTYFIKDWWESKDKVTLITRPRRFGKTLTMNMLNNFFSVQYANRPDLFEGLKIWEEEKYRKLQGTYPVILLSLANIKGNSFNEALRMIIMALYQLFLQFLFIKKSRLLPKEYKELFSSVSLKMDQDTAANALNILSQCFFYYYKKKTIILLDEYDTPMTEAWIKGYWEELVSFMRPFFNSAFKTNPYLERGIMTGITRVSKESMFSDLNNLNVVTTTSNNYADVFGFTEKEVFAAMDEYGKTQEDKAEVKRWFDGFTFGHIPNMYNPYSITCYLRNNKIAAYWADSSSNGLVGKLFREGDEQMKNDLELLMNGKTIIKEIDEQIVFNTLQGNADAVWSLLIAAGYLRVVKVNGKLYELSLTNLEVHDMFVGLIKLWFSSPNWNSEYLAFLTALTNGDIENMNKNLNYLTSTMFSYFDTGKKSSTKSEKFYHGFVLGLLASFQGRYLVQSNKESGDGRYDVMLKPLHPKEDDAVILEFKVFKKAEGNLRGSVTAALKQIEEKNYAQSLISEEIPENRIRKYGIAFQGKKVLIGSGTALKI